MATTILTGTNISGSLTSTGSVGRINFDGASGHTFIQETADDTLKIFVGGEAKMEFAEDSENIFMQANNYNFRDASFNNSFKIEANNHILSGSITSTGSLGRIETTTAGVRIGGYKSEHNYPLEVEGHAYVRGPDGWNGNGDLAIVALGSHAVNENFGVGYKYGTGMILSIYKSGGNGSFGSSTADAVTIADTSGDITLLEGADLSGSLASTGSFGALIGDGSQLTNVPSSGGGGSNAVGLSNSWFM